MFRGQIRFFLPLLQRVAVEEQMKVVPLKTVVLVGAVVLLRLLQRQIGLLVAQATHLSLAHLKVMMVAMVEDL
jgi:hypothetical protein